MHDVKVQLSWLAIGLRIFVAVFFVPALLTLPILAYAGIFSAIVDLGWLLGVPVGAFLFLLCGCAMFLLWFLIINVWQEIS